MKITPFRIITVLLVISSLMPLKMATADTGDPCCKYNDPNLDWTGGFSDNGQGDKKCLYYDKSLDINVPQSFLCGSETNSKLSCTLGGGKYTDRNGTQFDKYICVDNTSSGSKNIPDACCNYADPGIEYNPTTKQCVKRNPDGSVFGQTPPLGACATQTTSRKCERAGNVPGDGRPLYLCRDTRSTTVTCPGSTNPDDVCINTALGPIKTDPSGFVGQFTQIGIGIGSGLAFLQLLWGSYKLVTSQGNPDNINSAKDIITSAIIGLIFIVLGTTILQIIGFDILGLGPIGLGTR